MQGSGFRNFWALGFGDLWSGFCRYDVVGFTGVPGFEDFRIEQRGSQMRPLEVDQCQLLMVQHSQPHRP